MNLTFLNLAVSETKFLKRLIQKYRFLKHKFQNLGVSE